MSISAGGVKRFLVEYRGALRQVEERLRGIAPDEARHHYALRLLTRMMFLRFLQQSTRLQSDGGSNYLRAAFEAAQASGERFPEDRLYRAFFCALGGRHHPGCGRRRFTRRDVPLFDAEDDGEARVAVEVDAQALDAALRLFERYDFTADEFAPPDMRGAIDPEMLGKAFEESAAGRRESGSYYTPRPVVSFMCREALKSYLVRCGHDEATISRFVDGHVGAGLLRAPKAVLEALEAVRVCDPACGSGAFLLGMMREILRLRAALSAAGAPDELTACERKRSIIENNLYGADKSGFAVRVAQSRLWLALAAGDGEGAGRPIPDLNFNIETGDSLTSTPSQSDFDIVLTNPPYLSTKRGFGKENRALLAQLFETARGQFDAYGLFIERGLALLADGGCYSYIVPKPLLTNSQMLPVRRLMQNFRLLSVTDPGGVFDASVETIIITGQKSTPDGRPVRIYDENVFRDVARPSASRRPSEIITAVGSWNINAPAEGAGRANVFRGLPTFGEFFHITRGVEAGKRDSSIVSGRAGGGGDDAAYALLRGEDVARYSIRFHDYYVRPCQDDVKKFKPPALYAAPKLLIRRVTNHLIAAVDAEGYHVLNTLYVARPKAGCPLSLECACALLNSRVVNDHFRKVYVNDDKLFPYVRKEQIERLPIALPTTSQQSGIEELVHEASILAAAGQLSCAGERAQELMESLEDHIVHVYGLQLDP